MKILVRSPNWVGDHVMALPFYRALRDLYPNASITLLSSETIGALELGPFFDERILYSPKARSLGELFRLGRRLRSEKFDLAFSLALSFRGVLPLFFAGIPNRVGFSHSFSGLFFTSHIHWDGRLTGLHKSQLYLNLLEFASAHHVVARFDELHEKKREDLIIVAPGASIEVREWPYYQILLSQLRLAYPSHRIVVVGSPDQTKWSEMIRSLGNIEVEDLIGRTDLNELKKICAQAKLVIATDSGAAHVAASLAQAPTLVIFGAGDPRYIKPLGPLVYESRLETLPCSPCELRYCRAPYGYKRCLIDLPPVRVMAQVRSILG